MAAKEVEGCPVEKDREEGTSNAQSEEDLNKQLEGDKQLAVDVNKLLQEDIDKQLQEDLDKQLEPEEDLDKLLQEDLDKQLEDESGEELEEDLGPVTVIMAHPLPATFDADILATPPLQAVPHHGAETLPPAAPNVFGLPYAWQFPGTLAGHAAWCFWMGMMQSKNPAYRFLVINGVPQGLY